MTNFQFTCISDYLTLRDESDDSAILIPIFTTAAPFSEQLAPQQLFADYLPALTSVCGSDFIPSAKPGQMRFFTNSTKPIITVGVGEASAAEIITSIGSALRQLRGEKFTILISSALQEATLAANAKLEFPQQLDAAAATTFAAVLGSYRFTRYREQPAAPAAVRIVAADITACADALITAQRTCTVRDLVNTAPNDLNPNTFRQLIEAETQQLAVTILDTEQLAAEHCGGILGVGQGSQCPPFIAHISYQPQDARKHLAIIGKGITFDSGGLSLKISGSMENMKSDMAGAATAWQAVLAARDLQLPVRVDAWLAVAENMPGSTAQRVDDVVTMANGKTVEVVNTDCEGRMVMADALALAARTEPDLMIDIATLTGAQIIALGMRDAGVMGSKAARDIITEAANSVAEPMWPMPLPHYLHTELESPVADLRNKTDRSAGMLTAGAFLQEFVGETNWGHIDIAGPSWISGSARGESQSGGTGFGLRSLIAVARQLAEN